MKNSDQKNRYFPVYIDLHQKPCLVVGGGSVAQRKTESLLSAGAEIRIIAPQVTSELKMLNQSKKIQWIPGTYDTSYVDRVTLVIAATSDPNVNQKVYDDCADRNILVNVVDEPQRCSFIVPAVLNRGDIQVSVSTGGAAPTLAGQIRDKIAEVITEEKVVLVRALKQLRPRIRRLPREYRSEFWDYIKRIEIDGYKNNPSQILYDVEQKVAHYEKGML
ncbi:bifunctional precorrin-2 dehydrogenase/sirohydrochlorin ferrochelatase [Chitinispirillales bacterium ANBcel5]|uniref:precorrin-2 dehydrogenase/sirohydrochlorin ferrochelatase family protein n=1 Tax=Cellulosispirillum alkaliphilum TaxID=3039283 RepID=UPI002A58B216|nr:bifunctional precorrin-2 dehydrogenase/sirohydrochlorin ferrochelatase [Chitinispirillales bacterium ANBcel5]